MTTPVRIQQSIRQLETKGLTHTQIARELGVSRTTVVKYATRDYSPVPPTGGTASRSLVAGEYARKADEWLEADRRMPRKQRHTARRVHERLVEECGFEGSYSSVQRWVKRWRQRHRGEAEGFSELEWAPGSAQVDFGQALAVVAGVERTVHFLVVSFPYSNMRYVAALPGETAECVCHGLNKVFSHAGMVPRVLVFDNATGVGHRRADGTVTQTRLPRLNFVLVSTDATLRNGMVFVSAPSGIRPNRVFGVVYWMRVELAAMLVLSQKMITLGLKRSPMMFFSPGANVNSVMVYCVSAIVRSLLVFSVLLVGFCRLTGSLRVRPV